MPKTNKVMVCVTGQLTCERLIRHGAQIAKDEMAELSVVHAAMRIESILGNPHEGEALEYLFSISKQFGADMTI